MTRPVDDPLVLAARQRWRVKLTRDRAGTLVYAPRPGGPRAINLRTGRPDLLGVHVDGDPLGVMTAVDLTELLDLSPPAEIRSRRKRRSVR